MAAQHISISMNQAMTWMKKAYKTTNKMKNKAKKTSNQSKNPKEAPSKKNPNASNNDILI